MVLVIPWVDGGGGSNTEGKRREKRWGGIFCPSLAWLAYRG